MLSDHSNRAELDSHLKKLAKRDMTPWSTSFETQVVDITVQFVT